jgi:Ca2+-binding RTX toxin-like protein
MSYSLTATNVAVSGSTITVTFSGAGVLPILDVSNNGWNGTVDPATGLGGTPIGFRARWVGDTAGALLTSLVTFDDTTQASAVYTMISAVTSTGGVSLTGTADGDVMVGGTGGDTLDGVGGADYLLGGGGNDVLTGGAANDFSANDTLDGGIGDDSLAGAGGNDRLLGGAGADTARGGEGNDSLLGGAANDLSADSLAGEAGNDTIDGGGGADRMDGGGGTNLILVDNAGDIVLDEGATGGLDTVRTTVSFDFAANGAAVEVMVVSPANATGLWLQGNDLDNTITGAGVDAATGNADTLEGRDGNDSVFGAGGNDWLFAGDGDDTIRGGFGDDSIDGGEGADTLKGNEGDDIVEGEAGDDSVLGMEGADTIRGAAGADTLVGGAEGAEEDDLLLGGSEGDLLLGVEGADTLDGGLGADSMEGGLGDDTYVVDSAGDLATEGTEGGIDTVLADLAAYSLAAELEHLAYVGTGSFHGTGNVLDNRITGGANADTLLGGDGADTVEGGGGADRLQGGQGDDIYIAEEGDSVFEFGNQGFDTVRTAAASFTLTTSVERLVYTGAGDFAGTGTNGLDEIEGASGADTLDGRAGADTMTGGQGDDTYVVENAGDLLVELPGGGTDTARSTATFFTIAPFAEVENLVFAGTGNFQGFGNALDNSLTGGSGNDRLDGGAGADSMTGGQGDDTYTVDNAGDLVVEAPGGGIDTIRTSFASASLAGQPDIENLAYVGAGDFTGTGNGADNALAGAGGSDLLAGDAGADTLSGHGGADTLDGGTGIDRLLGGAGDDLYFVDEAGDVVVENGGSGIDTVWASGTAYSLANNVENLLVTGAGGFTGSGNRLANLVTGGGGADSLNGEGANDTLDGAAGADSLTGGAGLDRFDFVAGEANGDTVTDFDGAGVAAGDSLRFSGYGTVAMGATFLQVNATDWQVTSWDAAIVETIRFSNAAAIHASDVVFI